MKKLLIVLTILSISTYGLYAQNKTIKGRVIDDLSAEPIPLVLIRINDSLEVGRTDFDGYFQIELPVFEAKIEFNYVGFYPAIIELNSKCDDIEVIMMLSSTYDFISLKRAERKRKKRFKKFTEIHRQAFEKNIFKTEYPCYKREFEPFYLDK